MQNIIKLFSSANVFIKYFLLLTPVLLSSLFIYNSKFPAWANTLLLLSFVIMLMAYRMYNTLDKKKEISILEVGLAALGLLSGALYAATGEQGLVFNIFGKGIQEVSSVTIMGAFLVAAFFISLRGKLNKVSVLVSAAAVIYTVVNYFLIRNNISISRYTGYLNVPMLAFAKLINPAFIFSVIALASSLVAFLIDKKGFVFTKVSDKKVYKALLIIILILASILFIRNTFRFVGANYYFKASNAFTNNNLEDTRKYLDRATMIAPFDEYYLAKIELTTRNIQTLLASNATDTGALQIKYKELVEDQISNANKAINHDPKNPRNYMALGLAYERSMLLSKEDGYRSAVDAYSKARVLTTEKDYVDVTKAKLSFSAEKETEALSYIDSALKYNASSAPALFMSSQYYASKNNISSAIEYAEKTVLTAPAVVDGRLNLGLLYLQAGRNDEAIQLFGSVLQLTQGESLGAMYYLAVAYKAKGDKENLNIVITELEKRADPNSEELKALKSE